MGKQCLIWKFDGKLKLPWGRGSFCVHFIINHIITITFTFFFQIFHIHILIYDFDEYILIHNLDSTFLLFQIFHINVKRYSSLKKVLGFSLWLILRKWNERAIPLSHQGALWEQPWWLRTHQLLARSVFDPVNESVPVVSFITTLHKCICFKKP